MHIFVTIGKVKIISSLFRPNVGPELFFSYLSLKNPCIAGLRKYFSKINKDKRSRLNCGSYCCRLTYHFIAN